MKHVYLLITCLNLLDQVLKERFTEILDRRLLDRSLWKMIQSGHFPGWFAREFHYDALYSHLSGLREALSFASNNGLLRLDGSEFHYHLELSERVVDTLLEDILFERKEVRMLALELSGLLSQALALKIVH